MQRSLLAAAVAVAALAPAASAQAAPTLSFDQPCYSPGDTMAFSGTGYRPGGGVDLLFSSPSTSNFGSVSTGADQSGAIAGELDTPDPDHFVPGNRFRGTVAVTASNAGAGPGDDFGSALFTLSRFEVQLEQPNGARPRAGKPMRVTAVGYTNARGKTLYVHYRRGGRTRKTIKLGRLGGDCGDRTTTLRTALPRGLRRGRYTLVLNTSRTDWRAAPWQDATVSLR